MERLINFILSLLAPVYRVFGVDIKQLKQLVTVKLLVGNRTAKGLGNHKQKNMLVRQLIVSTLLTPMFFIILAIEGALEGAIMIYFFMIMLIIIMTYMTEYPYLLFNKTETGIIERLPVSDATLMAARLTSMIGYMSSLIVGMAIIPSCIIGVESGSRIALLFIGATLLAGFFSLLLANLIYAIMIKCVPADKFEKVTGYFQILIIAAVMASYQFINISAKEQNFMFLSDPPLWTWFTPSSWFAAIPMWFINPGNYAHWFVLIAIVSTILLAFINTRLISINFMNKATRIMQATGGSGVNKRDYASEKLAFVFTRKGIERSGFMLSWRLMKGNMKFKQSILPVFIYILLFGALIFYRVFTSGQGDDGAEFKSSLQILTVFYLAGAMSLMFYDVIGMTDKENVSAIYAGRPVEKPGLFLLGTFKAVYLKYFVPLFLILSIPAIIIGGSGISLKIMLCFLILTTVSLFYFRFAAFSFPFSRYCPNGMKGTYSVKIILNILFIMVLFGVQAGATFIPYAEIILIPITLSVLFWIEKKIRETDLKGVIV